VAAERSAENATQCKLEAGQSEERRRCLCCCQCNAEWTFVSENNTAGGRQTTGLQGEEREAPRAEVRDG